MAYSPSTSPTSKIHHGATNPAPTNPRDLLWHHQLKREHQHLLSLIKAQESRTLNELDSLKQQFLNTKNQQDGHSKDILELRQNEAAVAGESKDRDQRERQVLERIEGVEKETGGLGRKIIGLEQWVGETEERAEDVDGRVRRLEERPVADVGEVVSLKRKIGVMEKEMVRKGDVGEEGGVRHGQDGRAFSKTCGDGMASEDGLNSRRLQSHQQQQQSLEPRALTTSQTPSEGHLMDMVKPEDLQKWIMLSDETEKGYNTRVADLWNDTKNSAEDPELYKALSKHLGVKLADWKANNLLRDAQHRPEMLDTDKGHGKIQETDTWSVQVQSYGDDTMALNRFSHQRMVNPHPNYPNSMIGDGKPPADDVDDLYRATPLKQHTAMDKIGATRDMENAYNPRRSSASKQRYPVKHIEASTAGVTKVSVHDDAISKQRFPAKQTIGSVINSSKANGRKVSFSTGVLGVGEEQSPSRKTVHIDVQGNKVSGQVGVKDGTALEGAMAALSRQDNDMMEEANFSGEERVERARKRRRERQAMLMR